MPSRINWSSYDHLLGTMPDRIVAEKVECSNATVFKRRRELGISAYRKHSFPAQKSLRLPARKKGGSINWGEYAHLLGTMTDAELAYHIDCSPGTVSQQRNALGIPTFDCARGPKYQPWHELIGTMPDAQVAKQVGISRERVRQVRKYLDMPVYECMLIDWSAWDEKLGTMHDDDLAEMIGCSKGAVSSRRATLGIECVRRYIVDWREWGHLLGTMSDYTLAERIECPPSMVAHHRKRLNIKPFIKFAMRHNWSKWEHLLGTMSDAKLSKLIGCQPSTVGVQRRMRSIPTHNPKHKGPKPYKYDWDKYDHLLGTMFDRELAEMVGCSHVLVAGRRRIRGIKSYYHQQKEIE
jgi:hypothetical protein